MTQLISEVYLSEEIPLSLARHYFAEILSALEAMHAKGYMHGDLTTDNILMTEDFHIKIVRILPRNSRLILVKRRRLG